MALKSSATRVVRPVQKPRIDKWPSLQVSHSTLSNLGFESIEVDQETDPQQLGDLLTELHRSEFSHSWRWIPLNRSHPESMLAELIQYENSNRPTTLFFYHGRLPSGARVLVGAGTIAERINRSFPYSGIPVIARCYVLEKYRSHRLYRPFLLQRIEACKVICGNELDAIHMGSANPRIFAVIKHNDFEIPFSYIGTESLGPQDDAREVRDYLFLTDHFRHSLSQVFPTSGELAHSKTVPLAQGLLDQFLTNKADSSTYLLFKRSIEAVERETGWSPKSNEALRKLLTFFAAVPLREMECAEDSIPELMAYRTRSPRE